MQDANHATKAMIAASEAYSHALYLGWFCIA